MAKWVWFILFALCAVFAVRFYINTDEPTAAEKDESETANIKVEGPSFNIPSERKKLRTGSPLDLRKPKLRDRGRVEIPPDSDEPRPSKRRQRRGRRFETLGKDGPDSYYEPPPLGEDGQTQDYVVPEEFPPPPSQKGFDEGDFPPFEGEPFIEPGVPIDEDALPPPPDFEPEEDVVFPEPLDEGEDF